MQSTVRFAVAVVAGCFTGAVAYWVGAVVALLTMRGIPLGSAGGTVTPTELAVHLALAGLAGFAGAALATRLARGGPGRPGIVAGVLLGVGSVVAFGKPGSQWPPWFGTIAGVACLAGALGAIAVSGVRRAAGGRGA